MTQPTRILFIGNSYTYYNELWDRVAELAILAGYPVTVDAVTSGGYYLSQMADPTDPYGEQVAQKLSAPNYDVVILQEQSLGTFLHSDSYEASVSKLTQKIRSIGARPVLYQTWARKEGSKTLSELHLTPESMTQAIEGACQKVGRICQAEVSAVGNAFLDVVLRHPEIELYDPDGSHPSPTGTALAALCIFSTVFHRSPLTLLAPNGTESAWETEILKEAAHRATQSHAE